MADQPGGALRRQFAKQRFFADHGIYDVASSSAPSAPHRIVPSDVGSRAS